MQKVLLIAGVLAALSLSAFSAKAAGIPDPAEGRKFAQIECGRCHIIEPQKGKAPPKHVEGAAPAFHTIAYDLEMTADKIREALRLPHGTLVMYAFHGHNRRRSIFIDEPRPSLRQDT